MTESAETSLSRVTLGVCFPQGQGGRCSPEGRTERALPGAGRLATPSPKRLPCIPSRPCHLHVGLGEEGRARMLILSVSQLCFPVLLLLEVISLRRSPSFLPRRSLHLVPPLLVTCAQKRCAPWWGGLSWIGTNQSAPGSAWAFPSRV